MFEYEKKIEFLKLTQHLTDQEFREMFSAFLNAETATESICNLYNKINPCHLVELLNDTVFCSGKFEAFEEGIISENPECERHSGDDWIQ